MQSLLLLCFLGAFCGLGWAGTAQTGVVIINQTFPNRTACFQMQSGTPPGDLNNVNQFYLYDELRRIFMLTGNYYYCMARQRGTEPGSCCGQPAGISNGRWCTHSNGGTEGGHVVYECNRGFRYIGATNTRWCVFNTNSFTNAYNGTVGRCVPACDDPGNIANGRRTLTGDLLYDPDVSRTSMVNYSCNAEYELRGSRKLVCILVNGVARWNDSLPRCVPERRCNEPARILNGRVDIRFDRYHNDDDSLTSTATYTCNSGYRLIGNMTLWCKRVIAGGERVDWNASAPVCAEIVDCERRTGMWIKCSANCGGGVQYRQITFINPGPNRVCRRQDYLENRTCNTHACRVCEGCDGHYEDDGVSTLECLSEDLNPAADIIFVIDESSSMAGERRILSNIAEQIDIQFKAITIGNGTRQNKFGIVGFGQFRRPDTAYFRHYKDRDDQPMYNFSEMAHIVKTELAANGTLEDGYKAIQFALTSLGTFPDGQPALRKEAGIARLVVLITDEDRDTYVDGNPPLTRRGVKRLLRQNNAVLNVIVDHQFFDNDGTTAVMGVARQNANTAQVTMFIPVGGGPSLEAGYIRSVGWGMNWNPYRNTKRDYTSLALDKHIMGSAWDISLLRNSRSFDSNTPNAFAQAFVDQKEAEVKREVYRCKKCTCNGSIGQRECKRVPEGEEPRECEEHGGRWVAATGRCRGLPSPFTVGYRDDAFLFQAQAQPFEFFVQADPVQVNPVSG